MSTHEIEMRVIVKVVINDPGVITRVVENWDNQDQPQPIGQDKRGWQDVFYSIEGEDEVIEHLAYNCIYNACHDASRLDGWADLSPGVATMDIVEAEVW